MFVCQLWECSRQMKQNFVFAHHHSQRNVILVGVDALVMTERTRNIGERQKTFLFSKEKMCLPICLSVLNNVLLC